MFIHWGLYAIPARGEWVMSNERIPVGDYERYFRQFNPMDYDPAQWAKLARQAGMKYVVLTAKHHEGFCLWDTKQTEYNSMNAPCHRDLVGEYVEAVRKEGLKVGLYFSLIDWHHPDYPKYNDTFHPMRGNESFKDERIDFERYLDFMHAQIEELVSSYGKIDILWFDFSYDDMRNETWRSTDLIRMLRKYQPQALIDNRLETSGEGFGSIIDEAPAEYSGDFASPEQIIPHEGILNVNGEPVPWELCTTMNNNWGYNAHDSLYKSSSMLIRKLVECVSKNGNMILNIGPDANGNIPEPQVRRLEEIGAWMKKNGESIYGCGKADLPKPEWGYYTKKGNVVYAHVFEPPIGPLALPGISSQDVESVNILADGSEIFVGVSWITKAYPDVTFISFGEIMHYSYPLPDATDTVLKIVLKTEKA